MVQDQMIWGKFLINFTAIWDLANSWKSWIHAPPVLPSPTVQCVCSLLFVQLIKGCVYYFCGSVWPSVEGGHVAKKESFQFCFSCKISINVTLEPRHYSVLARLFLVGNSPFLVLLEWGKLYLEFVWTCCQKRIFSVLFLMEWEKLDGEFDGWC